MASSGSATLLPPVKSVTVYRNGDPFHAGRRFVVNHRQLVTMEAFLNDVTQCIQAPLAVRTLYTPRQGHRVRDLHDLQSGAQYVAAGFEKFKKLDYFNTGLKRPPVLKGEGDQARLPHRSNVSAKWRKYIPIPCIIHVFRNGDLRCPPFRFIIPRTWQHDLDQILGLVTEKASLRTGAVRRLYTLGGVGVSSANELESGQYYVAVGTERFKKLPYMELLVPKAPERNAPGNRRVSRRHEGRKAASGPEDRYSDSALLDSPESEGRRVKSTGDEVGEAALPGQANQTSDKEDSSMFHARPVKVRARNRAKPRPPPRAGGAQASVFTGGVQRRREEVRGAEEVQEDKNTVVELPVDQKEAETVDDEDFVGRHVPHSNGGDQSLTEVAEGKISSEKDPSPYPEGLGKEETSTGRVRNSLVNSPSPIYKEDVMNGSLTSQRKVKSLEKEVLIEPSNLNTDDSNQANSSLEHNWVPSVTDPKPSVLELKAEPRSDTPHLKASSSSFHASHSSQSLENQKKQDKTLIRLNSQHGSL
ncbi:doublecortin domain-containing protein 2B isoform X1 [Esox lucius]|uniref:Doublecortin domain-containing protein n=1 Tax=Esox lucius TaxID=8010 RepID=A0A3P9A6I2_ESOLU|nr:doublecortin domain-containing protein 2B isoform X1 [Esox lucius]